MTCQLCKQREATVHLTQIIENQMKKVDICEQCAKDKQLNDPTSFSLADLLLGLGAAKELEQSSEETGKGELRCPNCGFAQGDFKKTARLGCSECYQVFAEGLAGMLKGMHKGTQHRGKMPPAIKRIVEAKVHLDELEQQLKAAIASENFESAAKLRDEIKAAKTTA
jgi:protein arginine kinase activator